MPRIPIYEQQTTPSGGFMGAQATAGAFGGGVGDAMEKLGGAFGKVSDVANALAVENGKAYGANASATLALAAEQWKKDNIGKMADDGKGFTEQGMGWYDGYTKDLLEKAPDGLSRNYLQKVVDEQRDNFGKALIDQEYKSNLAWREGQIDDAMQNAAKAVYANPSLLTSSMTDIKAQIAAMNLPPEKRIGLIQKFNEQVAWAALTSKIEQQAPQAPNAVLDTLRKNTAPSADNAGIQIDAPNPNNDILNNPAVMDTLNRAAGGEKAPEALVMAMLSPSRQQAILRHAESVGNKIKAKTSSDLAIQVDSAQTLDQLPKAQDIDAMVSSGHLEEDNAYRIKKALEGKQQQIIDYQNNVQAVQTALAGGSPIDPKAKGMMEAADSVYAQFMETASGKSPQEQNAAKAYWVGRMGAIPTPLQQEMRQAVRSNNPEQVSNAIDMLNRMRQVSPNALDDMKQEDLRYLNNVQSLQMSGYSAQDSLRVARELQQIDPSQEEARKKEYDKLIKNAPNTNWLTGQLNSLWRIDPNIDATMLHEFDNTVRQEYQITGNMEGARRTALDAMQRVWGRSEVGKEGKRWMKWAPEKFYGQPNLSDSENAAWMNEQLTHDVSQGAMSAGGMDGRLSVVYNPAQTLGGRPTYNVILTDKDGILRHVAGADGKPMVWVPSYESSPAYAKRQQELADKVAKAKAERDAAMKVK